MGLKDTAKKEIEDKKKVVNHESYKSGKLATEVKKLYDIIEDINNRLEVLEHGTSV